MGNCKITENQKEWRIPKNRPNLIYTQVVSYYIELSRSADRNKMCTLIPVELRNPIKARKVKLKLQKYMNGLRPKIPKESSSSI